MITRWKVTVTANDGVAEVDVTATLEYESAILEMGEPWAAEFNTITRSMFTPRISPIILDVEQIAA